MSECKRHEWTEFADWEIWYPYCKKCKEEMELDEVLRRLNKYETLKRATDAFSVDDAIYINDLLDVGVGRSNALDEYARILGGEDVEQAHGQARRLS